MKYIVGDFLSLKGDLVKVIAVGFDYYTVIDEEGNDVNYIDEKDFTPIHITKEFLLNNGWEEIAQGYFQYHKSSQFDIYYLRTGNWQIMYKHKPMIEISYIHEMQHFLLGMKMDSSMELKRNKA